MSALIELIGTVRALRTEYKVPPSTPLQVRLGKVDAPLAAALEAEERALRRMARVDVVERGNGSGAGGAHAVLRGGTELFIPLADIIDMDRERARLNGELTRLEGQLRGTEGKLANENFVARAPDDVVAREREKAASLRAQLERLTDKLKALT